MSITHYIFVDFENVQKLDLGPLPGKPVQVTIVLGKLQKSVPAKLLETMLGQASHVRLVKSETTGRNALDIVLAWEVGVMAAADKKGCFHIISKDTGFDALITHLRHCGLLASREEGFETMALPVGVKPTPTTKAATLKPQAKAPAPLAKHPSQLTPKARAEEVRRWLVKYPTNRPKRKVTLSKLISSTIARDLPAQDLETVLNRLVARNIIAITENGAVTYLS